MAVNPGSLFNDGSLDLEMDDTQPGTLMPNVPVDDLTQQEIVRICKSLKENLKTHGKEKKDKMRICYGYNKQQFQGGDLLPRPSTQGNEKDANTNRPQVFVPIIRQEVKRLYSQLKLTMFPNDDEYFRIRGKNEQAAHLEDELTEGLKYIFKEIKLTEKLGKYLMDLSIAGNGAVLPTIEDEIIWEYVLEPAQFAPMTDPETGQPMVDPMTGEPLSDPETGEPMIEMVSPARYVPRVVDTDPRLDVQRLDPLNFYLEPGVSDPEKAKWWYGEIKKFQEIQDNNVYFNKDRLLAYLTKDKESSVDTEQSKHEQNDLQFSFTDTEDNVEYDLYYFPYLKANNQVFRNMIVGVAGDSVLIRFHPNLYPRGLNPAVSTTWMEDPDSPYGTGPAEDIMEIQRLLNIIFNYLIETLSRIGNRFVARQGSDLSGLFGVAGGIATTEGEPGRDLVAITGDFAEPGFLMNFIGMVKADAQITAGSQNPFQGASNIDFKKTATELQILQENAVTVLREVIEHIAVMGVARILERLMYLAADLHKEPIQVRVDDPMNGTRFITVDLSVLRSGQFVIELTNINPSQSKQQQVDTLVKIWEKASSDPNLLPYLKSGGYEILKKVLLILGEKDFDSYFNNPQEVQEVLNAQMAAQQQGIPGPEAGMGDGNIPPMA